MPMRSWQARGCAVAGGFLVAMMLLGGRSLAAAVHRSNCLPRGAHTLAKDSSARVFSVHASQRGFPGLSRRVYACLFRRGIPVLLGKPSPLGFRGVGPVALAGTTVAYADTTGGIDFFNTVVLELDLRTGRTRFSLPATTSTGTVESFYFVQALVLTPRGSAAWVGSKSSIVNQTGTIYEVHRALASGATSLLDQGPRVDPASLRLSRGTVSWIDGGSPMSAPLP
jgi:hypothetical protein